MIIWVDGTYCVGKTTVAKRLKERLGGTAELLESDYYSNETLKKILEEAEVAHRMPHIGGTLPQNNMRFIREFKDLIAEKAEDTGKKLIVDMALTRIECKENLFDCLKKERKGIEHIILTADIETIKERVQKDENRMKEVALEWLEDNRNIDDIVDEIIGIIKSR